MRRHNPTFLTGRIINQDWQRAMINGEDPFGILTDRPNLERLTTLEDNLYSTPFDYFCAVATPEQLQHAFRVMPKFEGFPITRLLSHIALDSNTDVICYVLSNQIKNVFAEYESNLLALIG